MKYGIPREIKLRFSAATGTEQSQQCVLVSVLVCVLTVVRRKDPQAVERCVWRLPVCLDSKLAMKPADNTAQSKSPPYRERRDRDVMSVGGLTRQQAPASRPSKQELWLEHCSQRANGQY